MLLLLNPTTSAAEEVTSFAATVAPYVAQRRGRAEWSWQIGVGSEPLAELTTAAGKTLNYRRNAPTEATCTLAHEDEASALLLDALADGIPWLKCYRRSAGATSSVLRMRGWLAPFQEDAEEQATLSLVFRSPFARLLGDGSDRGRFTGESHTITPNGLTADAGAIVTDLLSVANAQGATGLVMGAVETSVQRERVYQYANIGEAITGLTNVLDGGDFDETFTEGTSLAALNWYARLGEDKPDARFEYGESTLNNVRAVSRTTQPPINAVTVLGANGLVGVASDATSIGRYGYYPIQASASDESKQSVLNERAQALLRPNPIKTVTFTPEYALPNCPQPFDDFNPLGDTVRFYARRAALAEDVAVRLTGAQVVIDDNGFEATEIADPVTPEEEASIRASLSMEVVDG